MTDSGDTGVIATASGRQASRDEKQAAELLIGRWDASSASTAVATLPS